MKTSEFTDKQLLDELSSRLNPENSGHDQHVHLQSELQILRARLAESELAKSNFLANVRNEVNNPLTSIIGLASSIQSMSVEEKVKHMGLMIHKQASALEFQMRNIMVAAEIESGEMKLYPSRVNVVSLMEDVKSSLKHKIEDHQVEVQLEMHDRLKFLTDAQALEIICINLLANAIEFSAETKLVVTNISMSEGFLTIEVRDFGSGIEPKLLSNLFQRFKQGESGMTKKHCGHGLGLCVVNDLVSFLGGTIVLESRVNAGTTATVRIPEVSLAIDTNQTSLSGSDLLFSTDEQF